MRELASFYWFDTMCRTKNSLDADGPCPELEALLEENRRLKTELEKKREVGAATCEADCRPWPYKLMVENSLTGMYIIQDGRIAFSNGRFAEMFGYRRDELIGLDSRNLVPPQDRDTIAALRERRVRKNDAPAEYEIRGLTKDGRVIWTVRRNVLIDYDGKPAILGNAVEITVRKNMESRLKKSEEILRFLSTQLLQAHENERKRIARELHDTVAQNLTGIKLYLSHRMDRYGEEGRLFNEDLLPAVEMAEQSIREVRRLINDLRPSCIDDLGILATVKWHCGQFQRRHPDILVIKNLDIQEDDIPDALKVVIYRLLQESLNNVAAHSRADRVDLTIQKKDGVLFFAFRDNGVGFDIQKALAFGQPEKGWGIIGMKERAELSGGLFNIDSSPKKGTRVLVSWQC